MAAAGRDACSRRVVVAPRRLGGKRLGQLVGAGVSTYCAERSVADGSRRCFGAALGLAVDVGGTGGGGGVGLFEQALTLGQSVQTGQTVAGNPRVGVDTVGRGELGGERHWRRVVAGTAIGSTSSRGHGRDATGHDATHAGGWCRRQRRGHRRRRSCSARGGRRRRLADRRRRRRRTVALGQFGRRWPVKSTRRRRRRRRRRRFATLVAAHWRGHAAPDGARLSVRRRLFRLRASGLPASGRV